ncbi:C6 zinc finger domain protein [Fusarium beomiforme]|uniref:C6 zinc finger domain protein n=1 Tax=Fusarium beomiforme TaxID=44412 RepID=A0A9P5DZW4_9HYPO|nr:C6 zinc finger domain protein [Fusarium beomiforme]
MADTNSRVTMPFSFDLRAPTQSNSVAACIYAEADSEMGDGSMEDAVSNRQILDRLDEIKEILQKANDSPRSFSGVEPILTTTEDPQTPAAGSPWTRFSANAQDQPQRSSQVQPSELERIPVAALRCGSLLRWPALYNIVPSDARDVDSFPLSPGYKESSAQKLNSSGKGIDESSFVPLCRKFLAHVYLRNPALGGQQLIRHARTTEENGFWIKPNEYPIPPTQEQLRQR